MMTPAQLLVQSLVLLIPVVWNQDSVVVDGVCRRAVERHAPELFVEYRFPESPEIQGGWRFHSAKAGEDPACKTATLDLDEIPDYVAMLLPLSAQDMGFGLFAMTSFWPDGTIRYTVYPLHAETRGVLGETLLRTTKRVELRDDDNRVLGRGRGWLQIRPPHGGEVFAWCRNVDNPNPRYGIDSVEYVLTLDFNMQPTRLARFHWNTAGYFTRRSFCRVE